jgi:hypothetical protein
VQYTGQVLRPVDRQPAVALVRNLAAEAIHGSGQAVYQMSRFPTISHCRLQNR